MRLVATDLDGTIVLPGGHVTPRTLAVLGALEEAGIDVIFVTGRPPRWMAPVVEATGHRGEAICGNGAFVYDLHSERVTAAYELAPEQSTLVTARLREVLPKARFGVERRDSFAHEPNFLPRLDLPGLLVEPIEELVAQPVGKILVRDESSTADAMLDRALPVLAGIAEVTHSNSADCLLEISAPGVSKASTLALLCAQRGIDAADVVAFGDMPNDLPMLAWAGRGYAITGGHAVVLAAASLHAPGCADDGVAQVLEALLAEHAR